MNSEVETLGSLIESSDEDIEISSTDQAGASRVKNLIPLTRMQVIKTFN
jgi:hypothetical protein